MAQGFQTLLLLHDKSLVKSMKHFLGLFLSWDKDMLDTVTSLAFRWCLFKTGHREAVPLTATRLQIIGTDMDVPHGDGQYSRDQV